MTETDIADVEKIIGYTFGNKSILVQALTHASYANEKNVHDYERLEFLGDAVLNYTIASYLLKRYPNMKEGNLSKLRISLVRRETLADIIDKFGLMRYLRCSIGRQSHPVIYSEKVKCDVFEAMLAAVFLDCGKNLDFIEKFSISLLKESAFSDNVDYKSQVLEYLAKQKIPFSLTCEERSSDNAAERFFAKLILNGKDVASGCGSKKKTAENEACHSFYLLTIKK